MGQVNVNTPNDRGVPPEPAGTSGAGFIIGIIIAILVIAALVYFLVIAPPAGDGTDGDGTNGTDGDGGGDVLPSAPDVAPSGWVLRDLV